MAEGVDYSWARPGGAALKAAGKTFVVRYLYGDGQGGKGLDAVEVTDLRAHGLAIAVVYESSANRALSGRAAGQADARAAQAQLAPVGLPTDLPIYFGVDFDASASQQAAIDNYLRGVADVIGAARVGVYAGIGPIQRAQANQTATWFWQTYAWSGGRIASGIHLYQYRNGQKINGGAVDFCRSLQTNFGQSGDGGDASSTASVEVSEDVRRYQKRLIELGYNLGPSGADGIRGPLTIAAVQAFQKSNGLVPDGVVGPLTSAKLWPASAPKPAPQPAPKPAPKPKAPVAPAFPLPAGYYFGPRYPLSNKLSVSGYYGHAADLRRWQQRMKDRGWAITPDGLYGPGTARVVWLFQKEKKLKADSLIGLATWRAAWTAPIT